MNEIKELSDEELSSVVAGKSGGIFNASDISGADKDKPWEVINGKGDVVARCRSRDDAIYNAGREDLGYSELSWDQVCKMRG